MRDPVLFRSVAWRRSLTTFLAVQLIIRNFCALEFESAKKRTLTAKRRPLSTSNKQVWFLNKDTTSAILSSKNIAEQFTNIHKKSTRSLQQNLKKPRTKSALIDKVPKFTTVPSEYHELCRNKSVNEIMDFSLHGKGYGELDEGFVC